MILKTIVVFLIAQLTSLYFVHKLTYRGQIEYSILVNALIIGILAFFWLRYVHLSAKSVPPNRVLINETLKAVLSISIAFLVDYFIWLFNYDPHLRSLEWKNGAFVAAIYFAISIVTLLASFYGVHTLANKGR